MPRQSWSAEAVIAAILARRDAGLPLSSDRVHFDDAPLHGAARRYHGSWSAALEAAGIDPASARAPREPVQRWDREVVIRRIQEHAAQGHDLSAHRMAAIDAPLVGSAPRYLGSWDEALRAAGYDPEQIRQTRQWTPERVIERIQELHRAGADLSDQTASAYDSGLYGVARGHHGNWGAAVEAAGIDYSETRRTREWTLQATRAELRRMVRYGVPLMAGSRYAGLMDAIQRHFVDMAGAHRAAGAEPPHEAPEPLICHLHKARKRARISQGTLGERVGRSHRAISMYELMQVVPSLAVALRIARALGRPVEDLWEIGPVE